MVLANTVWQNDSLYKKIAIFFVFAFFFWCFSVAIHDILYPVNNLEFVRFLLKGDGTSASLSITNESAVIAIFYIAVVFEALIALVLFIASILMLLDFRYGKFPYANNLAMFGFALVLFKYFVFFVIVFAEWLDRRAHV